MQSFIVVPGHCPLSRQVLDATGHDDGIVGLVLDTGMFVVVNAQNEILGMGEATIKSAKMAPPTNARKKTSNRLKENPKAVAQRRTKE
jgi:hypothetical protein